MNKFLSIAGLALSFSIVACSHDDKPANTPPDPDMTPAARNSPSAPQVLGAESSEPLSDPQIVTVLRAVNVAEVDQARTAVGKVQNESVKKFAEMMIAQHGQASKNIDALDDKLGYAQTDSQLATELGVKLTELPGEVARVSRDARVAALTRIDTPPLFP